MDSISKMEAAGPAADEKSYLIPHFTKDLRTRQHQNHGGGNESDSDAGSSHGRGKFAGEAPDVTEMRKTTHNDPAVRNVDMGHLYGSTRMLRNSVIQHSHGLTGSIRRITDAMGGDGTGGDLSRSSSFASAARMIDQRQKATIVFLEKVKENFFEDAKSLTAGTIPQSVVLAIVIGCCCGTASWLYYAVLEFGLELFWETLPEKYFAPNVAEEYHWLWIPIVSSIMLTFVGLTVVIMGEPGDLPYTISRVHHFAYIPMDHVMPMVFASMFSIWAGGSLGPEAPLVAICGAVGGFISRRVFRQKYVNVIRKHTLMGMAGALAAFFGVPLGGSFFALEVCSRFGVEYFEHLVESIFCGEITLVVFRSLTGLHIAPIWDFTEESGRLMEIKPWEVLVGGLIGLMGALFSYFFSVFHQKNMAFCAWLNILDNSRAVYRAWLGGFFIILLGVLVPHTMFWGESEIQVVGNMYPASELPNIWPTTGATGFEMDSALNALILACAKMIAISFTVSGGLRGGYIFPLMTCGAALGRCIHFFFAPENVPVQICVLCMAAGINVAITRTSIASTLILAFLPGEPCAIPPILMASLCSLFATAYLVRLLPALMVRTFYLLQVLTSALTSLCASFLSHSSKLRLRGVTLTIVFSTRNISFLLIKCYPTTTMMRTKHWIL